jgi:hypothetical protein
MAFGQQQPGQGRRGDRPEPQYLAICQNSRSPEQDELH